jgi:hypothetical protein
MIAPGSMSQSGHSRQFRHVRRMSDLGVISELRVVRFGWLAAARSARTRLAAGANAPPPFFRITTTRCRA